VKVWDFLSRLTVNEVSHSFRKTRDPCQRKQKDIVATAEHTTWAPVFLCDFLLTCSDTGAALMSPEFSLHDFCVFGLSGWQNLVCFGKFFLRACEKCVFLNDVLYKCLYFWWAVIGSELRVLVLFTRCSIAWAMAPALFCIGYFLKYDLALCLGLLRPRSSCSWFHTRLG
jgi:hypothetical protein